MRQTSKKNSYSTKALQITGSIWFACTVLGQLVFIAFILLFYARPTFMGNFSNWNDKPNITGYVAGDTVGNAMFAVHVLFAVVTMLSGLAQLVPQFRQSYPYFHRLNGRFFILMAFIMALGGLWMTWVRGSYLSPLSAIIGSINGILILLFATLTFIYAVKRQFAFHKYWALSTFMVVNGVWFFRVGIGGWILLNQSPRWMNETLSGPADIALSLGSYLVPLAALNLYLFGLRSNSPAIKIVAGTVTLLLTAFMAVGIVGASLILWLPFM